MTNRSKTLVALLLGSSLLVAAAPAFAQSAGGAAPPPPTDTAEGEGEDWGWGRHHGKGEHGGKHHGRGEGRRGGHMMTIDANDDGAIGADEAASLADGMFMRLDENRDEILDEAEFSTPPGRGWGRGWFGTGAAEAEAVQKVRKEKFAALDTSKDGKLDKAEVFADMQQRLAAADTDKDGKVTPWEFRALPRM
jgi:EF hand